MLAWYYTWGISDILYGNGTLWQSSFFGASPNGVCSSNYGTTIKVLEVYDPHYLRAPIYI